MRTITETINVYKFDELTEESRERAREWFRSCLDDCDYDGSEYAASLEAFCEAYNLTLRDYCLSTDYRARIKIDVNVEDEIAELSHVRLWKYLNNQCRQGIKQGGKRALIDGHKFIRDMADGSCHLAGYHADCPPPIRRIAGIPGSAGQSDICGIDARRC